MSGMRPLPRPPMTPSQREPLARLDRTTQVPRRRPRAQMIFLAAEQGRKVPQLARMVRAREATVLRWRQRYRAEGLEGWQEAPRPRSVGRPRVVDSLAA